MQDLTRIDLAVERGELAGNHVLVRALQAGASDRRVHLIGLEQPAAMTSRSLVLAV